MWRLLLLRRLLLLLQTGAQVLLHSRMHLHVAMVVAVAVMVGSPDVGRWPGGMDVVLHVDWIRVPATGLSRNCSC